MGRALRVGFRTVFAGDGRGRHRRPTVSARRVVVACLAAGFFAAGQPVAAQQLRMPSDEVFGAIQFPKPPVLPRPTLELREAVQLTLGHSPVIGQSRETLHVDQGRYRETRGTFDPLFTFGPSFSFTRQPLSSAIVSSEVQKRTTLAVVASEFSALSQALNDQIAERPNPGPPPCPAGLRVGNSLQPGSARLALLQETEAGTTGGAPPSAFSEICSGDLDALVPARAYQTAWASLNQSGGGTSQSTLQRIGQIQFDQLALQSQNAQSMATGAALALQQLGIVPTDIRQSAVQFDVSLFKLFRNGITVGGDVTLASYGEEYVGKPLGPEFGGSSVPRQFTSSAQATVDVPLGRGRGRVAVAAPESAAERTAVGDQEQLRHDASTEAFRTIVAYLNLVAAQEQVRLAEESGARQRQIAALTESAVAAGTAAEMERNRARARGAIVATLLAGARAAAVSARVGLAQTIGIDLDEMAPAPLAQQSFAETRPALPSVDDLARQALLLRRDIRALERNSEAAAILAAGAQANLRRQVNLSFQAGFSTLYESSLPGSGSNGDGQPLSSAGSYSAVGYYRALRAPWAPFAVVSLSFQLPFGNHAARGRLLQAEATLVETRIRSRDLQRVVNQNVINATEAVRKAASTVDRWEAAVAAARQSLDAAVQQFQLGDATLIEVLLTEQELTDDLQQLVAGQQIYRSALARLRYETGGLVGFENEGTPNEVLSLDAGEFVGQP